MYIQDFNGPNGLILADYLINSFIKSLKSASVRESTREVLLYLSERLMESKEKNLVDAEWVRSKDLLKILVERSSIPYNTQFFRLLDKLCEEGLLLKKEKISEKRERGKPPVYYAVPIVYPKYIFYDRSGLIGHIQDCENSLKEKGKK